MKYEIVPSNQFKKDLKLAQKRGYDLDKIKKVITALANGETLEAKYRDHLLTDWFVQSYQSVKSYIESESQTRCL